jgi:O-methyltransferase involved in polyketide biosynthesis
MEGRLPMVTRLTVYALGAVLGPWMRRAHDPVAAWLIRHHPQLPPAATVSSMVSMIRTRTSLVDRLIQEEAERVGRAGRSLDYWSFGSGLDGRFYRLRGQLPALAAGRYTEIDDPGVLDYKQRALAGSSFTRDWARVERAAMREDRWQVPDVSAPDTLVVLEGVAARIGIERTRRLLGRVRKDAPTAKVVLDLPGILQTEDGTTYASSSVGARWGTAEATSAAAISRSDILRLGWSIREEVWLSARPELRAASGMALCAGQDAVRVLSLWPAG